MIDYSIPNNWLEHFAYLARETDRPIVSNLAFASFFKNGSDIIV